jgi:RHH-type proline utilization regulon transcriptional repressor/proline dehydrogenase/delta 1-pyrroline-5-carboxylate dehydrogenase
MNQGIDNQDVEQRTLLIGEQILAESRRRAPAFWNRRWWDDRVMQWTMRDEAFKVQLFRFVDVLPMLTSPSDVAEHLGEYLDSAGRRVPWSVRKAVALLRYHYPGQWLLAKAARIGARDFAKRFIAGSNIKQVLASAKKARDSGCAFTLDILGEAVTSDREADRYFQEYLQLLNEVTPLVARWPEHTVVASSAYGTQPRMNLSIKLSALDPHFDAIDPEGTLARVGPRLRELLRTANSQGAFINVDMESYDKKDLTLWLFKKVLAEPEFAQYGNVGIVIQCYLRDALADLKSLSDWAAARGTPVWVRLVKGAYWDYETVHARQWDWPIPVFQQKWQSDANYEACTRFALQHTDAIHTALGSHNVRSLAHGIAVADSLGLPPGSVEIQMLYGMGDSIRKSLVAAGHRVRVYMPYGELIPGMAYLVRRLLENTSNDSFLMQGMKSNLPVKALLAPPASAETSSDLSDPARETQSATEITMKRADAATPAEQTFTNEPPVDFAVEANRLKMQKAIADVRSQLGRHFPAWVAGKEVDTGLRIESFNPSKKAELIGSTSVLSADATDDLVSAAEKSLTAWRDLGATGRAKFLRHVAQQMRERHFELAALAVLECSKPWREATADVEEAIDFLEFYSLAAIALDASAGVHVPGEENRFVYQPRGVTAVIAPWNFPLAILTGMTAAALATGNPVIMKPAEQSPVMAGLLMEMFNRAGVPDGVVQFAPGYGEDIGAALVEHPGVSMIVFTGSRSVGLAINQKAAEVSARPAAKQVKRVIAEMGGKNAIIVDADADLDEAVAGVVQSAFAYQGQKCSACSRAVVLSSVYDVFLERLTAAANSLIVGPAEDPGVSLSAVIDAESLERVNKYIELGRKEGREVVGVDVGELKEQGFFVGPHVFADIQPSDKLAQEEVFGPVLCVIKATDLDEAFQIANSTAYALTGGIYSRSPKNLERATAEMRVGNLYLNRGITGAIVGRQPFGGFRMSGIGSKAGSEDYLLQFVIPRTVTENTMRRGFAPAE